MPRTAATNQARALVNAAKFTAARVRITAPARELNGAYNYLISKGYFVAAFSPIIEHGLSARVNRLDSDDLKAFLTQPTEKTSRASVRFVYFAGYCGRRPRNHFEPKTLRRY
jgi:hypothetical protein